MKITMPKANYDLMEFYDAVAAILGCHDISKANYNCTKINVASSIQQGFFDYYKELNPHMPAREVDMAVAILLLGSGPKEDVTLKANEVEVFDGFLC